MMQFAFFDAYLYCSALASYQAEIIENDKCAINSRNALFDT